MFSLSFITILVCVLSFYAYTYHLIDRLLIKRKGRGRLIPTKKNRNMQIKGQADDKQDKGSDKIYFLGLWRRKETEIIILFSCNNLILII